MILTSLVQFLNACYAAPNTAARRMHRLTNAALIFDEIQSLPRQCKVLFERAIRFLNVYGHSTVILCTATQPKLSPSLSAVELMPNVDALYTQLKRVHFVSQLDENRTCASAGKVRLQQHRHLHQELQRAPHDGGLPPAECRHRLPTACGRDRGRHLPDGPAQERHGHRRHAAGGHRRHHSRFAGRRAGKGSGSRLQHPAGRAHLWLAAKFDEPS